MYSTTGVAQTLKVVLIGTLVNNKAFEKTFEVIYIAPPLAPSQTAFTGMDANLSPEFV